MPISLRELYARKVSKDSETQSAINRALYEQEYTSGLITGASVGSGAYRNQLLGITNTPQDIVFDTVDAPPAVDSKVLTDDIEELLKFQNLKEGEVKVLSKPYKELFEKLDKGSATDEDYKSLNEWVSRLEYGGTPEGFLERLGKSAEAIGAAAGGLLVSIGDLLPGQESIYSSAYKMQEEQQNQFEAQKKSLLKKIQEKGSWLQGKKIEDQQTDLLNRSFEMLVGNPYSPLNQLIDFNKNFIPDKYGSKLPSNQIVLTPQGLVPITDNPLAADPYKQSLAKATLKNLTPGTDLYKLSSNEMADYLIDGSKEEFTALFGRTDLGLPAPETFKKAINTQKQILAEGLSKKAAYYMKIYEKAQKENDTELLNQSKTAIEKIQTWYKLNAPEQKLESGFFNAGKRTLKTLSTFAKESFTSGVRFLGKPIYSISGTDLDKVREYESILKLGEVPIAVPMDMNSDGKVNNLDFDYYGNPIFSNTFHYQGEKGEWKTNWAALPEVSAQVVGQMLPTIFMGGAVKSVGSAILPAAAGAEISSGIVSAQSLNLAQRGVASLEALNKWKNLRIADRIGTIATVTATTYDMMLEDELRFTKDVNTAKSRALGRAMIEGFTEGFGVPEFGILSPGRYGIGLAQAVREVGLASMPRALTRTQLVGRVLGGLGTSAKRVAGQVTAESMEELVADLGNYLMTSYIKEYDKSYTKEDPLTGQSLMNTFTQSFFSMLPFTGGTTAIQAINEYNSGQRLSASQWLIANNSEEAVSYIKDQQIKGNITEKEALRQVNEVNRLKDILGSMENIKNIKDLRTLLDDPEAQRRYFNLMVHKSNLTDIEYESLSEEEKKVLNNYTLNEKINDKGKALLQKLEEKRKELTPEELDTLTSLKAKTKKTDEEKAQEKELSERGQLTKDEMRVYFDLQKFAGMRVIDRSQLNAKDYKTLLDAKVITEEDLTPKKEDLEKQLRDTDEKLYEFKKLSDKYETLTKEQKNEIVTKLFQEEADRISQINSPAELAEIIRSTRKQLDVIKNFNTLSPLDYDLRASLVETAAQRFEELVTKDESGVNNLTRSLIDEDVDGLTVAELQDKYSFMYYQASEGYIDEKSQKELEYKYLSKVYNQILDFNKATDEEKIDTLVAYFDSVKTTVKNKENQVFELENLLADWTITVNNQDVSAEISEELFEAAQDKYFNLRNQNRQAGNSDASVLTTPSTTSATATATTATTPGVVTPQDYPTDQTVYTDKLETIEQSQTKDFYSKYAEEILAAMKANNYTDIARTLVATFSAKINEFANVKKLGVRAPIETHKKISNLLKDVVNGKKDFNTAYAEALDILNTEFPENQDLNLIYRKATKLYITVANVLSDYVDSTAEDITEEEVAAAKAADVEMKDISEELGSQSTEEVHDSVDLQKKEAALKAQEAQVMSWINPLRTAAFETNKDVVSEDPARVRNAEILNFVQNNPNAERRIQVSSREYFYKQILKGDYNAFVARLQKAIDEKDTSTETLNELQAFFGGDFFAVQPTATGVAELIYLIESEGEGLLKNPAPIVTFVVGEQLETFESNGKAYPFYANLSLAKHLEKATEAVEGVQAREIPTIVTDYKNANPEGFKAAVESGVALINGLRTQITNDPSTPIIFDLDYITQGFRVGSKIVPLQEVEAPIEVTFKTKKTNEDNGLLYPGTVGQGVALINGQPYLLFNQFVTEVGGLAEIEALAELIYNPEARAEFFDESIELIEYIGAHYNIFQAGSRKLEFSLKKGELEVFSVSIEKGKKKFTRLNTPEDFVKFMTKTDTPGVRYNVSQQGIGTKTRMFSMQDGNIVEQEMPYTQFVRKTHKILFSEDPNFRNKQVVFNEQSLRGVVKPVIVNPPAPPAAPAEKKDETWSFPERKPAGAPEAGVDYTATANKVLTFSDDSAQFKKQAESDLDVKNFIETVLGFSIDQNPPSLIKDKVRNYIEKQKAAPVSDIEAKKNQLENLKSLVNSTKDITSKMDDIFKILDEDRYKKWQDSLDTAQLEKDLKDKIQSAKSEEEIANIVTKYLLPKFIDAELSVLEQATAPVTTDALANIESFETAKGSIYTVLPNGKTQRFKTATGEQNEPNDLIVFVKFKDPQQEQDFLFAQNRQFGQKLYVIDSEGNAYDTNEQVKGKDVRLAIVKDGKVVETVETSLEPKIGYNTFDQRRYKEKGESYRMTHLGNKVTKINYKKGVTTDPKADIERRRQEDLKNAVLFLINDGTYGGSRDFSLAEYLDIQTKENGEKYNVNNWKYINVNGTGVFFLKEEGIAYIVPNNSYAKNPRVVKIFFNKGTQRIDLSSPNINTPNLKMSAEKDNVNYDSLLQEVQSVLQPLDAELKASEAKPTIQPSVKPSVKPANKPSFPEKVPFDTVVDVLNSVVRSMWEQMPKTRQGKVTTNPEGTNNYFVAFTRNGVPIEGTIEITFTSVNSAGVQVKLPMSEVMEASFTAKFKEVGQNPDGTPILEPVSIIKDPINLNTVDWNTASFSIIFEGEESKKMGYEGMQFSALPKDVLDILDPNEFLGTIISQLSGETVVPKVEPTVNPLAAAIMEQAKAPVAPETVQENVFTEEETKQGEDLKNNCTPNKAGKFKPMTGPKTKK